jgi:hypothetical protein
MPTDCNPTLFAFEAVECKSVVARFDGGAITSNAGALLLGQLDQGLGLVRRFAGCFTDRRDPRHVEHRLETLLGQRIFGLALGYEDERFGPYTPVGGPIPLHRYRKHRKSRREHRADQVAELAGRISLPRAAVSGEADVVDLGAQAPNTQLQPPTRPAAWRPFMPTAPARRCRAWKT